MRTKRPTVELHPDFITNLNSLSLILGNNEQGTKTLKVYKYNLNIKNIF